MMPPVPAPCSACEVITSRFDPRLEVKEDAATWVRYAVGIKYRCSCRRVGLSRVSLHRFGDLSGDARQLETKRGPGTVYYGFGGPEALVQLQPLIAV